MQSLILCYKMLSLCVTNEIIRITILGMTTIQFILFELSIKIIFEI